MRTMLASFSINMCGGVMEAREPGEKRVTTGESCESPRDSPAELVALYSFLSRW